ncbi:MAG TPA: methyl-accepting chemotaxis protein [Fibrobacteria bacterium]|nr:methyl-accepting chemotaxis protein [Fibrobacteria bacterium]HOX50924.1 methyl-accepting chemotaxis protein [Fibrobacteria bacterium]
MAPSPQWTDPLRRLLPRLEGSLRAGIDRRKDVGLRRRLTILLWAMVILSDLAVLVFAGASVRGFVWTVGISLAAAWTGHRLVVRAVLPVERLAHRLSRLASEKSILGERLETDGFADISQMAHDFNTLLERLEDLVSPLAQRARPLVEASENLSGFSVRMGGHLAAMETTSGSVTQATRNASNDLAGVSGSLQDVSACIGMLSVSADEISRSLTQIAHDCREEVEVTTLARDESRQAESSIEGLGREAEAIGGILAEIQAIASRTRLLALNATIEAARAGSAGRGFAVVAGEVKDLSRQTAESTERIRSMVESIQGATRSAVKVMHSIGSRVDEVDRLSRSIEQSVSKQTATIAEISSNAKFVDEQAASITEVVTNSGMQLSEAATTIAGLQGPIKSIESEAKTLEDASETLGRLGGELATMLDGFGWKADR